MSGNDSGAGSLRAARANANGFATCDTITFAPAVSQVAVATYSTYTIPQIESQGHSARGR